jgi:hypothetical protein
MAKKRAGFGIRICQLGLRVAKDGVMKAMIDFE